MVFTELIDLLVKPIHDIRAYKSNSEDVLRIQQSGFTLEEAEKIYYLYNHH
jgi:hypothetical protein